MTDCNGLAFCVAFCELTNCHRLDRTVKRLQIVTIWIGPSGGVKLSPSCSERDEELCAVPVQTFAVRLLKLVWMLVCKLIWMLSCVFRDVIMDVILRTVDVT